LFGLSVTFGGFENELPEHKKPSEAHATHEAEKRSKMSFGELSTEITMATTTESFSVFSSIPHRNPTQSQPPLRSPVPPPCASLSGAAPARSLTPTSHARAGQETPRATAEWAALCRQEPGGVVVGAARADPSVPPGAAPVRQGGQVLYAVAPAFSVQQQNKVATNALIV
jgi:hypothetical protein